VVLAIRVGPDPASPRGEQAGDLGCVGPDALQRVGALVADRLQARQQRLRRFEQRVEVGRSVAQGGDGASRVRADLDDALQHAAQRRCQPADLGDAGREPVREVPGRLQGAIGVGERGAGRGQSGRRLGERRLHGVRLVGEGVERGGRSGEQRVEVGPRRGDRRRHAVGRADELRERAGVGPDVLHHGARLRDGGRGGVQRAGEVVRRAGERGPAVAQQVAQAGAGVAVEGEQQLVDVGGRRERMRGQRAAVGHRLPRAAGDDVDVAVGELDRATDSQLQPRVDRQRPGLAVVDLEDQAGAVVIRDRRAADRPDPLARGAYRQTVDHPGRAVGENHDRVRAAARQGDHERDHDGGEPGGGDGARAHVSHRSGA
jgi:hypothetical protein